MKIYLLKTGRTISPFGDPVGESFVLGATLRAHQERLARELGLTLVEIDDPAGIAAEPAFVLYDHVLPSRRLARAFVEQAKGFGATRGLAVAACGYTRMTATLMDTVPPGLGDGEEPLGYHFYHVRGPIDRAALEAAPREVLTIKERPFKLDTHEILGIEGGDKPVLTRNGIVQITHWAHILYANQMMLALEFLDLDARKIAFYAWRALTAFPWTGARFMRRVSRVGRRCRIHPSAIIEGSIIGDDVRIGPRQHVLASYIGSGTKLEGNGLLVSSVVGERCIVGYGTFLSLSVAYPRSMISMPAAQLTVFGRQSVKLAYSFMMDLVDPLYRRQVSVRHEGKIVPSGSYLLGCALGHRAILGADVWIRAGGEIPNGAFLVKDQRQVFQTFPETLPAGEPHFALDGRAASVRAMRVTKSTSGADNS